MSLATCPTPERPASFPPREDSAHDLARAFRLFNELSVGLTDSYRALEGRVAELTDELARAHDARLRELTQKEQMAARLERLLEALPAGVIVLDGDGHIENANPAATALFGVELVGECWREVAAAHIETSATDTGDLRLRRGPFIGVDTCAMSGSPGQIVLIQDISERREQEARLARQERLAAMGEMSANLAHQLRTPLATAMLYASHLAGRPHDTESRRYAELIQSSLRHLERLANDILRYVRGDANEATESVTVGELLHSVVLLTLDGAKAAGATLTIVNQAADARVRVPRDVMVSAIEALLCNAWQAAGPGGRIELHVAREPRHVTITVHDDGPGVAVEHRARLFEPFFTTRAQGTGLGLAIVRNTMRSLGGAAFFRPRDGGGSSFVLTLPCQASAESFPDRGAA